MPCKRHLKACNGVIWGIAFSAKCLLVGHNSSILNHLYMQYVMRYCIGLHVHLSICLCMCMCVNLGTKFDFVPDTVLTLIMGWRVGTELEGLAWKHE